MCNKYKSRYVLGEGFPWAIGTELYTDICLSHISVGLDKVEIDFPDELWTEKLPRYRLVLEKIEDEGASDSVRFLKHLDRIAGLLGMDWTDGDFPIEECISLMKRESLL